ncbi:uncharacterized protein EV422DRAFT_507204 [Fimicolochytrium jonesii]|uniref:uncharacterized protein n=1 Tax=Fimicolochytrium jonesii TaxID=1396493 RepID=UPI0022FDC783|nr:uncharacterized protein EV422DRAFT_507204 [Fimicolochytrium jonesii]KAI8819548.1 hypothetical protein EV422DRAFT_507204 [Fimicolochytrium jonesii]
MTVCPSATGSPAEEGPLGSNGELDIRRITIMGPCGSGKSTLAARLASALEVPVLHLDSVNFKPYWVQRTPAEFQARLASVLPSTSSSSTGSGPRWVIDGNYTSQRAGFWPQTTLFIYVDLPLPLVSWRLLKRTVYRLWSGEAAFGVEGCVESFGMTFASKGSILLYFVQAYLLGAGKRERDMKMVADEVGARRSRGDVDVKSNTHSATTRFLMLKSTADVENCFQVITEASKKRI